MNDSTQPYLVRLPPNLARRVRVVLEAEPSAYDDFNEFVVAALENHLHLLNRPLEATASVPSLPKQGEPADQSSPAPSDLLQAVQADVELIEPCPAREPLFMLTNRLSPVTVPMRVLLNLTLRDGPPTVDEFLESAGIAARVVGLALQERDITRGPTPRGRRAIGWPVGAEPWKSQERFITSFMLRQTQAAPVGPLISLGLCNTRNGRVLPTELGAQLGSARNPLIGEADDDALSQEQQELLRYAVRHSGREFVEVCLFASLLRKARGAVASTDGLLASAHREWSVAQVSAHRSALTGRLVDIGVLELLGRGKTAHATLTTAGQAFVDDALTAGTGANK